MNCRITQSILFQVTEHSIGCGIEIPQNNLTALETDVFLVWGAIIYSS